MCDDEDSILEETLMRLKEIAQETITALERGTYFTPSGCEMNFAALLEKCVRGTLYYAPNTLESLYTRVLNTPPPYSKTEIEVVNETTLEGAARLVASGHYRQVGALNFASARNPGGGFLGGARAQEESLARSSGLYPSLLACREYYDFHRQTHSGLYSDRMIFSPACPILRNDRGDWLEEPYTVNFVTSAAPNAGAIATNEKRKMPQIPDAFRQRIGKVLALAAHHGCDALVLGAWGCGAFRNDPAVVAPLFHEYLRPSAPFWGRFSRVVFSVFDTSKSGHSFTAFAKTFAMQP
jgi:uncharacterized protein (TIGR02452 family)